MIPEGVPSQIGKDAMVLVAIIAIVRENKVRLKIRLDLLEPLLDRNPLAWKVAFAKRPYLYLFACNATQEILRTLIRLFGALPGRAEDYPIDLQFGNLPDQLQQASAGADFDIIRVRTKAQNATH